MNQSNPAKPVEIFLADSAPLRLWRWWSGELKAMLPLSMASWFDGDAIATNVSVDELGLTIVDTKASAKGASPAQRVLIDALSSSPVPRALIAAGRDRVRLVLSPDQALVKTITLPLATEENLRAVVGFELDRHTPFTPEQALYDVQIVRRDPQQEKIIVSLAVAAKSEIASLTGTLRRAGLTCTAIGIGQNSVANAATFDLQPSADKPPRRLSRTHVLNLGLLAIAALLVFVAVVLPIWQKRETVKALIPLAQKSGAEFLISERVYTEYSQLVAEYNFLATRKHAIYPVVSVIEELTRTFPDTTWVQKLDIKTNAKLREVSILGETQSASKVIENLEQSPTSLFQNSKQLTQTVRMQPNTERFNISAEIKPRPMPAAESIDAVVAPAIIAPIPPAITTVSPATATVTTIPSTSVAPLAPPVVLPLPATQPDAAPAKARPPTPIAPQATPISPLAIPPATPTSGPATPPPINAPAAKQAGT